MRLKRAIALIIDGFITNTVGYAVANNFFGLPEEEFYNELGLSITFNVGWLVYLGVAVTYHLLDVLSGVTLGKQIVGLKVRVINTSTSTLSKAFLRASLKVLSLYFLFGFILFFFYEQNSSMHDKLSGTEVVVKNKIVRT